MVAFVVLDPFEPDVLVGDELGAHHAQLLGPGERSDPGAQLDPPRRTDGRRGHRRHSMDEAHPRAGTDRAWRSARRASAALTSGNDSVIVVFIGAVSAGRGEPWKARASRGDLARSSPSRSSRDVEHRHPRHGHGGVWIVRFGAAQLGDRLARVRLQRKLVGAGGGCVAGLAGGAADACAASFGRLEQGGRGSRVSSSVHRAARPSNRRDACTAHRRVCARRRDRRRPATRAVDRHRNRRHRRRARNIPVARTTWPLRRS